MKTNTLANPTMTKEGRRIYVTTVYGHPIIAKLKELGAKWEPETKRWWVGSGKEAEVAQLCANLENSEKEKENPADIRIHAKATYKGRTYYIRDYFHGENGTRARLISLDGSIEFWKGTAEIEITKRYPNYRVTTLRSIQAYIEKMKEEEKEEKEAEKELEAKKAEWENGGRERGEPEPEDTRRTWHCLECGCVHYRPNQVEAGGMGCTRCN